MGLFMYGEFGGVRGKEKTTSIERLERKRLQGIDCCVELALFMTGFSDLLLAQIYGDGCTRRLAAFESGLKGQIQIGSK